MTRTIFLALAAAGAGFLIALGLAGEPSASSDPPIERSSREPIRPEADEAQLARIEKALRLEQLKREELGTEVERLAERVRELAARAETGPETPPEGDEEEPRESQPTPNAARDAAPGFDSEAIVAAGFDPARVEELRARLDQIEMDRLYLRDEAARDGWLGSARYSEENSELSESFRGTRTEFGDELYDWMLYATGRPNRVRVVDVIGESPALEAGLQAGDIILRYDDGRIFSIDELRERTTEGSPEAPTAVDIVREGRELRLYVPRGPLGIRLHPATEPPPPAG